MIRAELNEWEEAKIDEFYQSFLPVGTTGAIFICTSVRGPYRWWETAIIWVVGKILQLVGFPKLSIKHDADIDEPDALAGLWP